MSYNAWAHGQHQQRQQAADAKIVTLGARLQALETSSPLLEERVRYLEGQVASALESAPSPAVKLTFPELTPEEVQQSLNVQLLAAIRAMDIGRAIRLIKEGADVHAKITGTTALIVACGASFQEIALYILSIPSINVNATGDNGWTALCLAANVGLGTVVRVLLEKGADPNIICVGSPLYHACGGSHKEIAIRLIAAGADINAGAPNTPIFACGKRPEMAEVVAILNSPDPRAAALKALPTSAVPNARPSPNKSALAQQLLTAVQTDNVDEISRLVAAGISLRNLPGNSVTQRRLLNAVSPRVLAGPRNAKAASAAAREAYTAARLASGAADPFAFPPAAAKAAEKEVVKSAKAAAIAAARAAPRAAVPFAAQAVAAAAPAAVNSGTLQLIEGTLYKVRNGNVYNYDELTESVGDFVGRLTGDETINRGAAEVGGARKTRGRKNKRSSSRRNRQRK